MSTGTLPIALSALLSTGQKEEGAPAGEVN